jgi:hypothetical protein
MTTATATAASGTKGRQITVRWDNGDTVTFGRTKGNYAVVCDDDGKGYVGVSATQAGAAKLVARWTGIIANLQIVEILDPAGN